MTVGDLQASLIAHFKKSLDGQSRVVLRLRDVNLCVRGGLELVPLEARDVFEDEDRWLQIGNHIESDEKFMIPWIVRCAVDVGASVTLAVAPFISSVEAYLRRDAGLTTADMRLGGRLNLARGDRE